jgi:hypothetical protein
MDEFLKALESLLKKHNATILRSAAATSKLVISIPNDEGYDEIEFDEEINDSSIKYEFFGKL